MKRVGSLVGTILATIVNGAQVILNAYAMVVIFSVLSAASTGTALDAPLAVMTLGIYVILELFLIVAFILTCVNFGHVFGSPEKYAQKKGVTIASIVFNFLVMLMLIIAVFSGGAISNIIITLLCALALLATNILYIVDLSLENKRVARLNAQKEQIASSTNEEPKA